MTAFDLLIDPIKKYIYEEKWDQMRPIQETAISCILQTDSNYIISAKTASGKTEAAFLPCISSAFPNGFDPRNGVKILYISPLIALINDQFGRVENLCKHLDIKITKWHGEASQSAKKTLLLEPQGIVLITPESIEAMLANRPMEVKKLFGNLDFVIIDEIHAFIGYERGLQLQSLQFRLQQKCHKTTRYVGLSATLGDYSIAKKFFGNFKNTKIILDNSSNQISCKFKYFHNDGYEFPQVMIDDLYLETRNSKNLIFPNSRGKVEEITVKLKEKTEISNQNETYFAHHSSINKETREYVEFFAKNSHGDNFSIACTSTLELGIDIGSIDKVVQIDSTFSVASLSQRLGRSGRKTGISNLVMYATDSIKLLQNIACYELLKEKFCEPAIEITKPFDILFHQILSILKETSGISKEILIENITANSTFIEITKLELEELINHMISIGYIQDLKQELIIGIEAQYVVTSKDFYSVFTAEKGYQVINKDRLIGEISPPATGIIENILGENIYLAGKKWKIVSIDEKKLKFFVEKTNDGKAPIFGGEGGNIDTKIRYKMLEIILSNQEFDYLDNKSNIELHNLRKEFSQFKDININTQRPYFQKENKLEFWIFSSSKIYKTVCLMLSKYYENKFAGDLDQMTITLTDETFAGFKKNVTNILDSNFSIKELITETDLPKLIKQKWGQNLPVNMQYSIISERVYDFEGANMFLENFKV
jgi:ATP-dependent helicase Lhr and Lhr-like helicase